VQILRELRQRRGDAEWQRVVGDDLPQLAQLLPELGSATARAESESARLHPFDAAGACLARAGRAAPRGGYHRERTLLTRRYDADRVDLPQLAVCPLVPKKLGPERAP